MHSSSVELLRDAGFLVIASVPARPCVAGKACEVGNGASGVRGEDSRYTERMSCNGLLSWPAPTDAGLACCFRRGWVIAVRPISVRANQSGRDAIPHAMADEKQKSELWLIRHGETEWSLSGAHTSFTDLPLTEHGREQAMRLQPILGKTSFGLVLTSPRTRARVTAQLAGLGVGAQVDGDLQEWNYGVYEGKSTPEIRKEHPGWNVWKDPITGGETLTQVALRAQCVIERCLARGGRCALFAHAHIFRILAGVWCGALDVTPEALARSGAFGEHLGLSTASVSVLGFERDTRVISRWNELPPA